MLPFRIHTSQQFLSGLLEDVLDKSISEEVLEVNSVEIRLSRVGEAEMRASGKTIDIKLPIKIQLKRAAGLFTVEGNGALVLHLRVNIAISNQMRLSTHTELIHHEWIEKPVLEIGALNIPVETLVNLVLNHHESILTAKIDSGMKQYADLSVWIRKGLGDAIRAIPPDMMLGNKVEINIHSVYLKEAVANGADILIEGKVASHVLLNSEVLPNKEKIEFEWMAGDAVLPEGRLLIPVDLPYDILEKIMVAQLKDVEVGGKYFDIRSIDMRAVNGRFEVEMEIDEPIKAQVFVRGKPRFEVNDGMLHMDEIEVRVNPANLIYKLTAPLVNKFVVGKMEDMFPIDLAKSISDILKEHMPKKLEFEQGHTIVDLKTVAIGGLDFQDKKLKTELSLNGLFIENHVIKISS